MAPGLQLAKRASSSVLTPEVRRCYFESFMAFRATGPSPKTAFTMHVSACTQRHVKLVLQANLHRPTTAYRHGSQNFGPPHLRSVNFVAHLGKNA